MATMEDRTLEMFDETTTQELLGGVLLHFDKKFPEQAVYRFFLELERQYPGLKGRYGIAKSEGRLRSKSIRRALDFFEMGKIVRIDMPNPVDQYYSFRTMFKESLTKNLEERGILPKYQDDFKRLSDLFASQVEATD